MTLLHRVLPTFGSEDETYSETKLVEVEFVSIISLTLVINFKAD